MAPKTGRQNFPSSTPKPEKYPLPPSTPLYFSGSGWKGYTRRSKSPVFTERLRGFHPQPEKCKTPFHPGFRTHRRNCLISGCFRFLPLFFASFQIRRNAPSKLNRASLLVHLEGVEPSAHGFRDRLLYL